MLSPRLPLVVMRRFWTTTVSFFPTAAADVADAKFENFKTKEELLQSYTVTPPIKSWPQQLNPNHLISMIRQQQKLDLALQIFDHADQYHPGFSHTYDTYYAIILKFCRARAFPEAESLIRRLRLSGIKCNEKLFVDVIHSYGIASRPRHALRTFLSAAHPRSFFGFSPSVKSFNALLNALVQNKRYSWVHSLFFHSRTKYGIIPNVITCNILIKALCSSSSNHNNRGGGVEAAIRVLHEMPAMGIVPTIVTYTTILGGFASLGDMVNAQKVFDEILERGWLPDATTYTVLMNGFIKQDRLLDAVKVMDDMEENGVKPNDVTYGVMIEAYCKQQLPRKSGEALSLLYDMLHKKYIPAPPLCCRVIDALCEEGKVDEALELWRTLLKKNCTLDDAISSTLIHWLCKNGKILEAKKLFDKLGMVSIPSALTYNTLIAGMCEAEELLLASRLWDDMVEKGYKPNTFTYNMLIKGFCKVGSAREGVRFLEEMVGKRCFPNKSTYSVLIQGLCDSKLEGDVITRVLNMAALSGEVDASVWESLITKLCGSILSSRGATALDRVLLAYIT